MEAVASYAAGVLADAGYPVLRADYPGETYRPDYAPGHEPMVQRVDDGVTFPTESAFQIGATTPGLTCVVRPVDQVQPGDCGFVPFRSVSPEWNNFLADVGGQIDAVRQRGGVAVVLQGDIRNGALIAVRSRRPIPTVVASVSEAEILGREVRLRVEGSAQAATLHDVVAIRPPVDPSAGYVLLQGHMDGWFTAAADNGGGAAAVLAAAERLAGADDRRGLIVVLYDGEEWGLQGSEAFRDDLADGMTIGSTCVHLDDVAAVVNLDAPSAIPSDVPVPVPLFSWRVLVSSEDVGLTAAFAAAMTGAGVLGLPVTATLAEPINGGLERTDAQWFDDVGIPVAWPVAGYPEYHTTADTLATVDPADLRAVTTGAVALVRSLDGVAVGRLPGSTLAVPGSSPGCDAPVPTTSTTSAPVVVTAAAPTGSLPTTGGRPQLLLLAVAALGATTLGRWCWPPSRTRRSRASRSGP
jgi:hypothetical protein